MRILYVNSQRVLVTKNLHAALQRLRCPDRPRTLWVDALSINQTDREEKTAQVSIMNEIYSSALRCLIWLGEEPNKPARTVDQEQNREVGKLLTETNRFLENLTSSFLPMVDRSDPVLSELEELSLPLPAANLDDDDNFRITKTRPCIWHGDDRDAATLELRHLASMQDDSIFQAFCMFRLLSDDCHLYEIPFFCLDPEPTKSRRAAHWLVSRDWWTRVWTVQECILPTDCTVIYGPVEMPWCTLLTAVSNFQRHQTGCCSSMAGIHNMLNLHVDIIPVLQELRAHRRAEEPVSLDTMVREFRYRAATNPRDKIYALLPLVTDWGDGPRLSPDYTESISPRQVYSTAVFSMIKSSGSLMPLFHQTGTNRDGITTLPSWVPDFSKAHALGGTLDHFTKQLTLYNACCGMKTSAKVLDTNILALEGVRVDFIDRASTHLMNLKHERQLSIFEHWYEVAEEECKETNPNWRNCFWRTLCGDTIVSDARSQPHQSTPLQPAGPLRRVTGRDEALFGAWCTANNHVKFRDVYNKAGDLNSEKRASSILQSEDIGAMNHAIRITTRDRRFIVSRSGRLGIAPKEAVLTSLVADEIFVIAGSRTPVVLRPVGTRDVPSVGRRLCHELIGDCYLHGVMDGETMYNYKVMKQKIYIV